MSKKTKAPLMENKNFQRSVLMVDTGYEEASYHYADFMNAVNSVTDFFLIQRGCKEEQLADCLELFAKQLRSEV